MELDTSQIHVIGGNARPIHVTVDINDISLSMELDTGAVISEQQYKSSLSTVPLLESEVVLKTYTGENMRVLGELTVTTRISVSGPSSRSNCWEWTPTTGTKLASTFSFGLGSTKIGYHSRQY